MFLEETGRHIAPNTPSQGKCIHGMGFLNVNILHSSIPDVKEVVKLATIDAFRAGLAANEQAVVVVCGTGYIMPDAREFLGIVEPR